MKKTSRQYTIRNVPGSVDRALRRRAAAAKVSLSTVVLRALEIEAGLAGAREQHDLDAFFGSWVTDARGNGALEEVRHLDPKGLGCLT